MAGEGEGAPVIGRAAHGADELAAAEAHAHELKTRFAFALDDDERRELLRLASDATMRVNTMRAAIECAPSVARRAADEAARVLGNAKRMLVSADTTPETRSVTPPKRDARGTARSSPISGRQSNSHQSPSAESPAARSTGRSPAATVHTAHSPQSTHRKSPEFTTSTARHREPSGHSPDVEHAAAVRLQRVQRGRAARERVRQLSDAKRAAARGAAPSRSDTPTRGAALKINLGTEKKPAVPLRKRVGDDNGVEKSKAPPRTKSAPASRVRDLRESESESNTKAFLSGPERLNGTLKLVSKSPIKSLVKATPVGTSKAKVAKAMSAERAVRAAARRLKVKLEEEMSKAEQEAKLKAQRAEQRLDRLMFPGEEKFYERLDHARSAAAGDRSRPTSAARSSSRPTSATTSVGRSSTRSVSSPMSSKSPKHVSPPKSALVRVKCAGSSRTSRSLRVSFEAASVERRDRFDSPPGSSAKKTEKGLGLRLNPVSLHTAAMRRAEAAKKTLHAAELAVAQARYEAERLRMEALLGPALDDSESEYGSRYYEGYSPLKNDSGYAPSPTKSSHLASPMDTLIKSVVSPIRSEKSARSSGGGSLLNRSSVSASIQDDLGTAPSAPVTPTRGSKYDEDTDDFAFSPPTFHPKSAPPKNSAGMGTDTNKRGLTTPETSSSKPFKTPGTAPPDQTSSRLNSTQTTKNSKSQKAKQYAQGVREMANRRVTRKAAADAEQARIAAQEESKRLIRESKEGKPEATEGMHRASKIQRDAVLYSRDMYRRAATAAFVRYYTDRRGSHKAGACSDKNAFNGAVYEKELIAAVKSMPAFAGLHPRFLPRLFGNATLETFAERQVVFHEGERSEDLLVVVGGEIGLFQKPENVKGLKALSAPQDPWNPDWYPSKTKYKLSHKAGEVTSGDGLEKTADEERYFQKKKRELLNMPGWEICAKQLGAPNGAGLFVRRLLTGELFGMGAVSNLKNKTKGEARTCTGVALSECSVLKISKQCFDDVLGAVQRSVDAQIAVFLRSTELFPADKVLDGDLKTLASVFEKVECESGDRVVTAGDTARGVFFVRHGTAEVFAKSRVLVDAAGGGDAVDQSLRHSTASLRVSTQSLRLSGGSLRSSSSQLPLRRRTGTGGGASGNPLVERIRDVHLGELASPAVFGEECLCSENPKRNAKSGGMGPGRHAFTVRAKKFSTKNSETLLVFRLAPEDVHTLPESVKSRLLQLAKSTAEASAEAYDQLDSAPTVPGGRNSDVVGSVDFIKTPPSLERVGVVFGSSKKPPPNLVERNSYEHDTYTHDTRDSRESPIAKNSRGGLGGGGGRTRESSVGRSRSRSPSMGGWSPSRSPNRAPSVSPSRDVNRREPSPYSKFMGADTLKHDESFERTAAEVTKAALREAKSAERKLREYRAKRATQNERSVSSARPASRASLTDNGPKKSSGAGAGRRHRQNSAPVIRLTKKTAAMYAKNAPSGHSKSTMFRENKTLSDEKHDSFTFRTKRPATAGVSGFQFDAERARGVLEESNRSRERSAEVRHEFTMRVPSRTASAPSRRYEDLEKAWQEAGFEAGDF